jgi:uncharacterized membrane protein
MWRNKTSGSTEELVMSELRIWHVGNWCIHQGAKYIESPFEYPSKDVEVVNYAEPLVRALERIPGAAVRSQPSWELYHMSPQDFRAALDWATTIIFADVETKCLMLHPDFFNRAKWGERAITFEDRFEQLSAWIESGNHFHMNGGWLSFAGELGKGGWGRSRLRGLFPVECLTGDDLIESTAGYPVRCSAPDHPAMKGIDWSSLPPLLGFNETRTRPEGSVLVEIQDLGTWHPLLAERKVGNGRFSCWMTGASPHWGINFMRWRQYDRLWLQLFAREG